MCCADLAECCRAVAAAETAGRHPPFYDRGSAAAPCVPELQRTPGQAPVHRPYAVLCHTQLPTSITVCRHELRQVLHCTSTVCKLQQLRAGSDGARKEEGESHGGARHVRHQQHELRQPRRHSHVWAGLSAQTGAAAGPQDTQKEDMVQKTWFMSCRERGARCAPAGGRPD